MKQKNTNNHDGSRLERIGKSEVDGARVGGVQLEETTANDFFAFHLDN